MSIPEIGRPEPVAMQDMLDQRAADAALVAMRQLAEEARLEQTIPPSLAKRLAEWSGLIMTVLALTAIIVLSFVIGVLVGCIASCMIIALVGLGLSFGFIGPRR